MSFDLPESPKHNQTLMPSGFDFKPAAFIRERVIKSIELEVS